MQVGCYVDPLLESIRDSIVTLCGCVPPYKDELLLKRAKKSQQSSLAVVEATFFFRQTVRVCVCVCVFVCVCVRVRVCAC